MFDPIPVDDRILVYRPSLGAPVQKAGAGGAGSRMLGMGRLTQQFEQRVEKPLKLITAAEGGAVITPTVADVRVLHGLRHEPTMA